jgi:hypothetical protein
VETGDLHLWGSVGIIQDGIQCHITTSLEDGVPSQALQPFVITKHPSREQRRALCMPPLSTPCLVLFAPSPQGPEHIRSIAGGAEALDAFLVASRTSARTSQGSAHTTKHSSSGGTTRCVSSYTQPSGKPREEGQPSIVHRA